MEEGREVVVVLEGWNDHGTGTDEADRVVHIEGHLLKI